MNAPQQSQINYYYCGPATASEILSAQGVYVSQQTLGGNNYLQTDANGGTNWSPYVMGPTLNSWTNSQFYAAVNGSGVGGGFTTSDYTSDLTTDVDLGWALAGNVVENSGGPHLNGHPGGETIYHWIAIKGYTNYGNYSTYDDSVSGDGWIWSWANNVPPVSTISSSDMASMLNGRGFVW